MSALLEMAERCEAATGLDRALDADIRLTVLGDCTYGAITGNRHQVVGWGTLGAYVEAYREVLTADDALDDAVVPRFTASLDAALTLVPEGWRLSTLSTSDQAERWRTSLRLMDTNAEVASVPAGDATTAALAVCAAALRARAAQ